MGVDRQLTFEILLYLNIFYFCLYAGMQALFLLMKYIYVQDMGNTVTTVIVPRIADLSPDQLHQVKTRSFLGYAILIPANRPEYLT